MQIADAVHKGRTPLKHDDRFYKNLHQSLIDKSEVTVTRFMFPFNLVTVLSQIGFVLPRMGRSKQL